MTTLFSVILRCESSQWLDLSIESDLAVQFAYLKRGEGLELLTNIRDFTTLFSVTLRCESSKWLDSSSESDLGMRFAIRILDLASHDFAFFKHSF